MSPFDCFIAGFIVGAIVVAAVMDRIYHRSALIGNPSITIHTSPSSTTVISQTAGTASSPNATPPVAMSATPAASPSPAILTTPPAALESTTPVNQPISPPPATAAAAILSPQEFRERLQQGPVSFGTEPIEQCDRHWGNCGFSGGSSYVLHALHDKEGHKAIKVYLGKVVPTRADLHAVDQKLRSIDLACLVSSRFKEAELILGSGQAQVALDVLIMPHLGQIHQTEKLRLDEFIRAASPIQTVRVCSLLRSAFQELGLAKVAHGDICAKNTVTESDASGMPVRVVLVDTDSLTWKEHISFVLRISGHEGYRTAGRIRLENNRRYVEACSDEPWKIDLPAQLCTYLSVLAYTAVAPVERSGIGDSLFFSENHLMDPAELDKRLGTMKQRLSRFGPSPAVESLTDSLRAHCGAELGIDTGHSSPFLDLATMAELQKFENEITDFLEPNTQYASQAQ